MWLWEGSFPQKSSGGMHGLCTNAAAVFSFPVHLRSPHAWFAKSRGRHIRTVNTSQIHTDRFLDIRHPFPTIYRPQTCSMHCR